MSFAIMAYAEGQSYRNQQKEASKNNLSGLDKARLNVITHIQSTSYTNEMLVPSRYSMNQNLSTEGEDALRKTMGVAPNGGIGAITRDGTNWIVDSENDDL